MIKQCFVVLHLMLFMIFCGAAQADTVKIYAAASLTDVITELSELYKKSQTTIDIQPSFAGSATLAKQIEHGAPADIFVSADTDWINYLQTKDLLINDSHKIFLLNELVLIAPIKKSPINHLIKISFDPAFDFDASFRGHLCTGDTASVPVGKYAKQSLEYYGWWDKISSRIVGADDVRSVLAFVERGECSLGIVYKTDASLSKKIKLVATFPTASHAPIEYSGALTKNASADAKMFWNFLHTKSATAVYTRYGFIVLDE